jgi:hypothetical protein
MTTSVKAVNYTKDQEAELKVGYPMKANTNKEFVDNFSKAFNKTPKSIIAKLVSLGVYKTEVKMTKSGKPITTKAELVDQIETHFGFDMPSLVKATKTDLQSLVDTLA